MPESLTGDLAYASATELVGALANRRIGALEAAEQAIARIERRDGPINAVVVRDFDRAREAARAADAALAKGDRRPLLGLPVTVKETHDVAGLPTTWGIEALRNRIAVEDSAAVARLRAAGAVILGKTNIPPLNADWQTQNPLHGRTNNPWDVRLTPGGSSGGSAASLAAGLAPLELASDIGGSIRVPAAFCGVYGHKPSYELIPIRGHALPGMDDASLGIATVGPMARTAADLDLAVGVLAGPDRDQAAGYRLTLAPPRHKRIGAYRVLLLDRHPRAAVDDEICAALHGLADRIAGLGARVSLGSDRLPDLAAAHDIYAAMIRTAMTRGQAGATRPTAYEWLEMLAAQAQIRQQWAAVFEVFDVVLAPVFGVLAFAHLTDDDPATRTYRINGEATPNYDQLAWPGMATLGRLPATAAPIGLSKAGLPVSVQIIGPYLEDRTTIGFAGLLEREFGGFRKPPSY